MFAARRADKIIALISAGADCFVMRPLVGRASV